MLLPRRISAAVADIFKSAAGTACDDSLIYIEFSVLDFVFQCEVHRFAQTDTLARFSHSPARISVQVPLSVHRWYTCCWDGRAWRSSGFIFAQVHGQPCHRSKPLAPGFSSVYSSAVRPWMSINIP